MPTTRSQGVVSADGESRTPTGLLPHGSEPRLSTGSKHVRKLHGSGAARDRTWVSGASTRRLNRAQLPLHERPGRDSNPRLRGCSPADAQLSYLADVIPGEGFEPDSSLGSEPSVLPFRRSRSVENLCLRALSHTAPVPSQSSAPALAGCLSHSDSDGRPGSIEPGPRTPFGTVRVLPSSARVHPDGPPRTRTSDRLPPGRALQNNEGRPVVALVTAPGVTQPSVGHGPPVVRQGVTQRPPPKSMQRPRCRRISDATDRFVADMWLMCSHGVK